MDIVDKIYYYMNQKGVKSINDLANRSLLTQSTVDNIMRRKNASPRVETLEKICEGLGITLADFFADEIHARAEVFTFNKIIEEINSRDIPQNIKELVIKFVNESRDTLIPAIIKNVRAENGEIQIDLVGDIRELVEKYKNLSPKQQEALKMVIDAFSRVQ